MYDEPTAGLDPVASTVVEDLVRSLHVKGQTSFGNEDLDDEGGIAAYIVVTHQHSTIRRSVDRIIFLHEASRASCKKSANTATTMSSFKTYVESNLPRPLSL